MLVLGIDPGLNVTGYGLVEMAGNCVHLREAGVIRNRRNDPLEAKLGELYRGLTDILTTVKPAALALEQLYSHYERPRTAILMGHARGVICLAATQAEVPLYHYAATQVKKTLTGNGRAPKAQVQLAICREFGLAKPPEPHDVADALAIALCHVHFGCKLAASITALG
jgi:crossover junction endodeoxyribonuclease RuvC